jgi:hypothetical protein
MHPAKNEPLLPARAGEDDPSVNEAKIVLGFADDLVRRLP